MRAINDVAGALRDDVRFACRSLARAPSYTATVVLTLGLALGGLSAVFSILYAVVLRPLPFPESEQLVVIQGHFNQLGTLGVPTSPNEFLDIRSKNHSFSNVAALAHGSASLTGRGPALHVNGGWVSADFFRVMGVAPTLGRDFAPGEDQATAQPVVLLGSQFHRRAFAGAADVIGQTVQLEGRPHTIIGVVPDVYEHEPRKARPKGEDFEARDVWVPLVFTPEQLDPRRRGGRFLTVIGRLKPGSSQASAMADMTQLGESFYKDFPQAYQRETGFWLWVEALKAHGASKAAFTLTLLLAAVALVLLAASANVVSLTLARLAGRQREIALRAALGASAGRIALQFLVESVVLALAGGLLGVIVGRVGMDALVALSRDASLRQAGATFQLPVLSFALVVSVITGLSAGVAPAWHAARLSPTLGLREGSRATSASALRLRSVLVVAQVAVALVLLVGTGMLLRSVVTLTSTSPGFSAEGVHVAKVALAGPAYTEGPSRSRFANLALERVRAIPGVQSVGVSDELPLSGWHDWNFLIQGEPEPAVKPNAQLRFVAGDYFKALELGLVRGRVIGPGDTAQAPDVAVVNQSVATRYFPGKDAIGARISFHTSVDAWRPFTIVGIVNDTRDIGMDEPEQPFVFIPFEQFPSDFVSFVIKAPGVGDELPPALRDAIAAVDPTQAVYSATTLQELVAASLGSRRFTLLLLSVFAGLGLGLAALGIYGITSYSVAQRTQELAVRMALGADERSIMRLVLVQALKLVGGGLLLGTLLALILARYLAKVIYGLAPWDPRAVALIACILITAALVAGFIPARRAALLPLANALRTE